MNFYIIYDNLYEEFQNPFIIKNDTIAKEEFLIFKNELMAKAKDNEEKNKINSRFYLYKFAGVKFTKDDNDARITIEAMGMEPPFTSKAEPIEWGNEGDNINE